MLALMPLRAHAHARAHSLCPPLCSKVSAVKEAWLVCILRHKLEFPVGVFGEASFKLSFPSTYEEVSVRVALVARRPDNTHISHSIHRPHYPLPMPQIRNRRRNKPQCKTSHENWKRHFDGNIRDKKADGASNGADGTLTLAQMKARNAEDEAEMKASEEEEGAPAPQL